MNIVLAGKPGVGKTTLFSRLVKRKIYKRPKCIKSLTSDNQKGTFEWDGKLFSIEDTMGLDSASMIRLNSEIFAAAEIIFVMCDAADYDSNDTEIIKEVRRFGKPIFLVANKVESEKDFEESAELYGQGLPVFPISALHKFGIDELLDEALKIKSASKTETKEKFSCIAVGAPNVGKSTFLNALLKKERFKTSPLPGTTNEIIEEFLETPNGAIRIIDTAGIFRRTQKANLRLYNLNLLKDALAKADTVCFIVDASAAVGQKDLRIASLIKDKPCLFLFNKRDRIPLSERRRLARSIPSIFPHLPEPPVFFISALLRRGMNKIPGELFKLHERCSIKLKNIDKVIKKEVAASQLPLFVLLTRQVGYSPPKIVIKFRPKRGVLPPSSKRRIASLIRNNYDLAGVPLIIRWKKL